MLQPRDDLSPRAEKKRCRYSMTMNEGHLRVIHAGRNNFAHRVSKTFSEAPNGRGFVGNPSGTILGPSGDTTADE